MSAPALIKAEADLLQSIAAAQCNAVLPLMSTLLTSIQDFNKTRKN